MKIGYLTKKFDACYWVRCTIPMGQLSMLGHDVDGDTFQQTFFCQSCRTPNQEFEYLGEETEFKCRKCNQTLMSQMYVSQWKERVSRIVEESEIVVFQRPTAQAHLDLINKVKSMGKKTVQTGDDLYTNVPSWNSGYNYYSKRLPYIEESFRVVDAMDVTTPGLKDEYSKYCRKVDVLHNCQDVEYINTVAPTPSESFRVYDRHGVAVPYDVYKEKTDGKKIFLWGGSPTHEKDLEVIINPVRRFVRSADDIVFCFFGYVHRGIMDACPKDKLFLFSLTSNEGYFPFLKAIKPYASMMPICDVPFNTIGKSENKMVEAMILNQLPIASKLSPYYGNSPGAFFADNTDYDWYLTLKKAYSCDDYEDRIAQNKKFAEEKYDIAKQIGLWVKFYEEVLQ